MTDYKATLNLPETDFPMKANLPLREPEMLRFWSEINLYHKLAEQRADWDKFILHDGPPYANGHTHIGHAVNKTLKDVVNKSKLMSGFNAPYVPGWDCHGLPIELNVEKKIGKAGVQVSVDAFRAASRDYAESQVKLQREEFMRLGVIGDWANPYRTMDFHYEADIIRALGKIIANGHLVHGRKPVHWCVDCGSALAEAEVEYKDKTSHAIDVAFTVLDQVALFDRLNFKHTIEEDVHVPIWTTTPWTLPANEAVAFNPKHPYVLVEATLAEIKKYYIVAESLLSSVMKRFDAFQYQVLASALGDVFEGLELQHPFLKREVPIVMGDHVTLDAGTGAVHTAPAHGQDDYVIGSRYHLRMHNPVDNRGCFHAEEPFVGGQHVFKANEIIIDLLQQNGKLLHEANLLHSYPHCWRHKTPLIFRATPQWFISMDKNGLRQQALAAIANTQWVPEWGEARIAEMVNNRPDWCISRQRVWGTPMPLFIDPKTFELHPDTLLFIEEVAKIVEEKGVEAWDALDPATLLGADTHYVKVTDTLDVWFDSGVSHAAVLARRPALQFPADLYLEGSDQHRGWFQTSLLSSVAMNGTAPFKTVLTHGFTVDAEGRKMSKSLGNVIAPEQVIKRLGADVLRLWVATTDYRGEMTVSDEILTRASDAYRRVRNTARFLLSNLNDFSFENLLPAEKMLDLDRWAVDCAWRVQQDIIQDYEHYQFHQVVKKILHFCSIEMGGFYLDIIKDRLYTMQPDSNARRSAQTAMYHIAHALTRWIAPILSFTAEEIWQHMPGKDLESVFMNTWYDGLFEFPAQERERWHAVMMVRDVVNKELENARKAGVLGSGLAAEVTIYCNGQYHDKLQFLAEELRFVTITSSAEVAELVAKDDLAVPSEIADVWIKVSPAPYAKCERCWHRRSDIGADAAHPNLCGRCIENVAGSGERRQYA